MSATIAVCTNVFEPALIKMAGTLLEESAVVVHPPPLRLVFSFNIFLLVVSIQSFLNLRMSDSIELETVL